MDNQEKTDEERLIVTHEQWYGTKRIRIIVWTASFILYAAIVLTLGDVLVISNNYFVILPVIIAALAWGSVGGIIAGALALPANLALFAVIGHPEYAPASLVIAESSGIVIGTTLGILGDRFRLLGEEIQRRRKTEEELRAALEERNLLIREIRHRVKNNLSVIKGMLYLRMTKTEDAACREAFRDMTDRLMSMALVQDQLNAEKTFHETLDAGEYLKSLVENIAGSRDEVPANIRIDIADGLPPLSLDRITPLGILVNEVITNAYKHALPDSGAPHLSLSAAVAGGDMVITIADNGPGYDGASDNRHLGRMLIDALAAQIRGTVSFDGLSGTRVTIRFPLKYP